MSNVTFLVSKIFSSEIFYCVVHMRMCIHIDYADTYKTFSMGLSTLCIFCPCCNFIFIEDMYGFVFML